MNNFPLSFIISHGYLDIFKFKDKSTNTILYILTSLLFTFITYIFPIIGIITFISNTFLHFSSDFYFLYKKNIYWWPTIFVSSFIGEENYNFWDKSLDILTIWPYEKNIIIVFIFLYGILMSFLLLLDDKYLTFLGSCLYGYYCGPLYSIYLYMIIHSGLSYIKNLVFIIDNPINKNIPCRHLFLIGFIVTTNIVTYYSLDYVLYFLKYRIFSSIIIGILNMHLLEHNYNLLDDTKT